MKRAMKRIARALAEAWWRMKTPVIPPQDPNADLPPADWVSEARMWRQVYQILDGESGPPPRPSRGE